MIQIMYTLAVSLIFIGSNSIVLKVALLIIIGIVLLIIVIVIVCFLLRKYKKSRQDNDMVFNPAYSRTFAEDMVHNPAYATNAAAPRPPSDPTKDEYGYMRVDNY